MLLADDRNTIQAVTLSKDKIGEAALKISWEYQEIHSRIHWKEIIGLRNCIVHAYSV